MISLERSGPRDRRGEPRKSRRGPGDPQRSGRGCKAGLSRGVQPGVGIVVGLVEIIYVDILI